MNIYIYIHTHTHIQGVVEGREKCKDGGCSSTGRTSPVVYQTTIASTCFWRWWTSYCDNHKSHRMCHRCEWSVWTFLLAGLDYSYLCYPDIDKEGRRRQIALSSMFRLILPNCRRPALPYAHRMCLSVAMDRLYMATAARFGFSFNTLCETKKLERYLANGEADGWVGWWVGRWVGFVFCCIYGM